MLINILQDTTLRWLLEKATAPSCTEPKSLLADIKFNVIGIAHPCCQPGVQVQHSLRFKHLKQCKETKDSILFKSKLIPPGYELVLKEALPKELGKWHWLKVNWLCTKQTLMSQPCQTLLYLSAGLIHNVDSLYRNN